MPYRLAFTPSGRKAGRALFREMLRGIKNGTGSVCQRRSVPLKSRLAIRQSMKPRRIALAMAWIRLTELSFVVAVPR